VKVDASGNETVISAPRRNAALTRASTDVRPLMG